MPYTIDLTGRSATVLRQIASALVKQIPQNCLLCGMAAGRDIALCELCEEGLPWLQSGCYCCGRSMHQSLGTSLSMCSNCLLYQPAFDSCHSLFHYRGAAAWLISRFKYQADMVAGRVLAKLMAERARTVNRGSLSCDNNSTAVVPIPLHRRRLGQRGFNQSYLLARQLALALDLPLEGSLLKRECYTEPQVALQSRVKRQRNLAGAFQLAEKVAAGYRQAVLVDDVVTTQSTLEAASSVLRSGGIESISCWTLARAELRR